MEKTKHTIWSDIDLNVEDWIPDLLEENPDMTREEMIEEMYRINNEYLLDERDNLKLEMVTPIMVFADIGRWNGRFNHIGTLKSRNLADLLYSDCDMNEWYVDEDGEFRWIGIHHDGRNHALFRLLKKGVDPDDIDEIRELNYGDIEVIRSKLMEITEPLGPVIGKVYGW